MADGNSDKETAHHELFSLVKAQVPAKILLVDDDELVLRAFARDLHGSNLELTLARSGREGLDLLSERRYALIVADFQMPGMDGITFLEEVRRKSPSSIRILMSGKTDFEMAIQVINRVGLFNFILKPWTSQDLRDTIRRAVTQYQIAAENRRLNNLLAAKYDELALLARSLEEEVQNRTTSLLVGMANALDLRDTETQWHSRRVALYSKRLAEQLGLNGEQVLAVERGALLHDVGKIGVSDTILLKPGKLTNEEWEEMKKHSEYGYRILQGIDFLGDARLLVWEHHERWDGTGYPRGLKGDQTCIGARIFAVIDTYDAMTSDRPYRRALPHQTACQEIARMSGTQFDPQVVNAWKQIHENEIVTLRDSIMCPDKGLK